MFKVEVMRESEQEIIHSNNGQGNGNQVNTLYMNDSNTYLRTSNESVAAHGTNLKMQLFSRQRLSTDVFVGLDVKAHIDH